jgi:C1A family cysteine protease
MNKREYIRVKDAVDSRDRVYKAVAHVEQPSHVDLSSKCSPIENQGQLGSCTGNAITGLLEYLENIKREKLVRLSRLFVYFNERMIEGTINSDAGANIRDGIKSILTWGVCSEDIWPYDVQQFKTKPNADAYIDAATRKDYEYASVPQTEHAICSCLASGSPLVFGITVYESLESAEVAKSGIAPMPAEGEKVLGGHALLIVGYDKKDQTFLIRNSWGPHWGIKGYFKLPFAYVLDPNLADSFWTIRNK